MAKIYVASDHAGFDLKNALVAQLRTAGHEVEDCGAHALDLDDDYPDFVTPCAMKVAAEPDSFGIVIGGSGEGEAMAANRVKGVRAAVYYGGTLETVRKTREDNNANILSLGARFVTGTEAQDAVRAFLETPFSGEARHVRRIAKF